MKIAVAGGTITIEFVGSEPELLRLLAIQLDELIDESEPEDADVLLALFPDAYREDAESAAEFGRLTGTNSTTPSARAPARSRRPARLGCRDPERRPGATDGRAR